MESSEGYDAFRPLQQSSVYAGAVARLGARVRRVDLGCGDALVLQRGRLQSVLRGPVWQPGVAEGDRRRALRRLARWPGVTVVTPEEEVRGLGLIPLITPMHHAVLDLGLELRKGMGRNWRNHLRQAERAGIRVRRGDLGTLEQLIDAEAGMRDARRYHALPARFLRALHGSDLRVWEWRLDGSMHAAMVFIRHGGSASNHMARVSEAARRFSVHHLMLTRAAESLASEGVSWLDLG